MWSVFAWLYGFLLLTVLPHTRLICWWDSSYSSIQHDRGIGGGMVHGLVFPAGRREGWGLRQRSLLSPTKNRIESVHSVIRPSSLLTNPKMIPSFLLQTEKRGISLFDSLQDKEQDRSSKILELWRDREAEEMKKSKDAKLANKPISISDTISNLQHYHSLHGRNSTIPFSYLIPYNEGYRSNCIGQPLGEIAHYWKQHGFILISKEYERRLEVLGYHHFDIQVRYICCNTMGCKLCPCVLMSLSLSL